MGTTIVLDPVSHGRHHRTVDSHAIRDFAGLRIAVLDNTKPNAVEVMERIAQILVRDYAADGYDVFRKLSAAQGASEAQFRDIAAGYQLVITGSGDCGGCTSWSALDAVELERRGVTSVLLVTDAFVTLARTLVAQQGIPHLRFAEIPHPIGGKPTEAMAAIGEGVAQSVVDSLKADIATAS